MKILKIKFSKSWVIFSEEIDEQSKKFLTSLIEYEYDDDSTIRDLLKYFTRNIESIFYKYENYDILDLYKDKELKQNFLYVYENIPKYIYNLDTKIAYFINKLNIVSNDIVFEFGCSMFTGCGEIWTINGIKYYMHSNERTNHNKPHVHVKYQDKEVSIDIITGEVLAGGIKNNIQKEAIKRIINYKRELILAWNTMTNGEKIFINESDFALRGEML